MKMKTVIVLAFAVGCGLIAMMGVQQMIAKQSAGDQDLPVKVLVATVDISPGVLLNERNSEFKEYPSNLVPGDAVKAKEDYVDRGLLVPVSAGDVIRITKLGERGEINASASIPDNMRTFSFKVDDTKTHSGLLQPGDRVDLQVSYDVKNRNGALVTKIATLLEYIEVFASDSFRNLEAGESKEIKAKNITLLVTQQQSQMIQLADTKGELIPIMRNRQDKTLNISEEEQQVLLAELRTGMIHDDGSFEEEVKKVASSENEAPPLSAADAFKDFLNSGKNVPQQPVVVKEQPVEPKQEDMWVIQVYAGEEIIEQEVALPASLTVERDEEKQNETPKQKSHFGTLIQGLFDSVTGPENQMEEPTGKFPEQVQEDLTRKEDQKIPVEL